MLGAVERAVPARSATAFDGHPRRAGNAITARHARDIAERTAAAGNAARAVDGISASRGDRTGFSPLACLIYFFLYLRQMEINFERIERRAASSGNDQQAYGVRAVLRSPGSALKLGFDMPVFVAESANDDEVCTEVCADATLAAAAAAAAAAASSRDGLGLAAMRRALMTAPRPGSRPASRGGGVIDRAAADIKSPTAADKAAMCRPRAGARELQPAAVSPPAGGALHAVRAKTRESCDSSRVFFFKQPQQETPSKRDAPL